MQLRFQVANTQNFIFPELTAVHFLLSNHRMVMTSSEKARSLTMIYAVFSNLRQLYIMFQVFNEYIYLWLCANKRCWANDELYKEKTCFQLLSTCLKWGRRKTQISNYLQKYSMGTWYKWHSIGKSNMQNIVSSYFMQNNWINDSFWNVFWLG